MALVGYATFWDPGVSAQRLHEKHRSLFSSTDWLASARFARETDAWRWRQIRLATIEAGLPFTEQEKRLTNADKPAAARELVTFLVLHFLATGERFEMDRWRCRDVVPYGCRVIVGPFGKGYRTLVTRASRSTKKDFLQTLNRDQAHVIRH